MGAIRASDIATKASILKHGVLCTGVHSWLVSKSRLCAAKAGIKAESQMVRNRQAKTDMQTDRQTGRQTHKQTTYNKQQTTNNKQQTTPTTTTTAAAATTTARLQHWFQ